MTYLASGIYIIGPLSVAVMIALFASMGKRLGQALELPPYYRLYYVSIFFFIIPLPVAFVLLMTGSWGLPNPAAHTGFIIKLAVASIPLTIAITFAVIATAKYWGWIWGELRQPQKETGARDGS